MFSFVCCFCYFIPSLLYLCLFLSHSPPFSPYDSVRVISSCCTHLTFLQMKTMPFSRLVYFLRQYFSFINARTRETREYTHRFVLMPWCRRLKSKNKIKLFLFFLFRLKKLYERTKHRAERTHLNNQKRFCVYLNKISLIAAAAAAAENHLSIRKPRNRNEFIILCGFEF